MKKANIVLLALALGAATAAPVVVAQDLPAPEAAAEAAPPHAPLFQYSEYPRTEYPSIIDTNGWSVPMPFTYYPQGAVNEDGTGIYQCLVPPEPASECFCTPPPCYFGVLYFGGIILDRRSNLERNALFFDNTNTEVLNTGDLDFAMEAGFRLGYYHCDPCGIDWNFDYFSVQNYQAVATRSDPLGISDSFFGLTNGPFTSLTAEYESNLDSLEFNLRTRQWQRFAPLVGVRFLQVDEHFNSLQDSVGRTGSLSQSDNELYGLQFGAQGLLFQGPNWRFETTVKAGPYYNDIDLIVTPPSGSTNRRRIDRTATSLIGDLQVTLVCQLGPRVNFRIGYRALWVEGIALAPNQTNNFSFTTNVQTVDLSGVVYQGGDLGFEVSW